MIRKLLPVLMAVLAFAAGALGGDLLRGTPADVAAQGESAAPPEGEGAAGHPAESPEPPADHGPAAAAPAASGGAGEHGAGGAAGTPAWFKFPQQFFVPILRDGRLDSTMVLTLTLEMPFEASEAVYAHEFRLRDSLLRQLLIHANTGGFDGNFTAEAHLRALREALLAAARDVRPEITAVLIGDIARQER